MDATKHLQQWTEQLQPHVPEQLLAVGMFGRAGSAMAGYVGMGSGLAGSVMRHQAKQKSAGLPQNVVAALTPTKLYLWKWRSSMTGKLRVKGDPELVLERSAFVATIGGNDGLAHRVTFTFGDGSTFELDSHTSFGSDAINVNLLNQLVAPAYPPAPGS